MKYVIQTKLPICPLCSSAMINITPLVLKCWDCKSKFKISEEGITEREMVYELITKNMQVLSK